MRRKRVSIRLRAALAIFVIALFVTGTCAAQQEKLLYSFNGTDGREPVGGLIFDGHGNLYGTTVYGGNFVYGCSFGCGTVFELSPNGSGGWTEQVLYRFSDGTDGGFPYAGLIFDAAGNLYGTTAGGGAYDNCDFGNGCGTVFELSPNGSGGWTERVLYSFCSQTNCTDGTTPEAGLIFDAAGNLYGTTQYGGTHTSCENSTYVGCGTAFELSPNGSGGWSEQVLYKFGGGTDGANPLASLIFDAAGNLYGTTYDGGTYLYYGTAFELTRQAGGGWTETVLHSFGNGTDGQNPYANLIFDNAGNLYGTTFVGGTNSGTAFELSPNQDGGWTETLLYNFGGNGREPEGGLIFDGHGNLYGTTFDGAGGECPGGCGIVFELSPRAGGGWTEQVLHNFGLGTDGQNPTSGLIFDAAGNLYGVTAYGGIYGTYGTVFEVTPPPALQFVTATPCRVVDTRNPNGPFGGPPIQGGTFRSFPIPQGACNIPASAGAYSLNVTVVPHGPLGYLTIWPTGQNQPLVSTLNSTDGRVKANAAFVPAGTSGAVSVYVTNTTDLILDIDGYFASPGSGTLQFYSLPPCRLVDTRGTEGELGGPRLQAQTPRSFPLLMSSCIPSGLHPNAYSLNFTVVPNPSGQPLSYLTVWPTGETQPVVSTLNNPTATVVANAAITPAGTDGAIDVYAYNTTDLLIDIDGYFAAPGTGGLSLYAVAPCRVLDTRQSGGSFMGEKTVNVAGSACAPPSSAQAYVFNATVVPPGSMPYLTLWPNGEQQPVVSTLNAYDGFITSNMAIVTTTNGSIDAYAAGLTQLILDISGYFAR